MHNRSCVLRASVLVGMLPICSACSGGTSVSPSGPAGDTSAFLGAWDCAGTQVETCGAVSHSDLFAFTIAVTQAAPGAITTTLGNDLDLTTGATYSGIALGWSASGTSASLTSLAAQPTIPGSVGGTWTPTYATGTLSLSGGALAWNASGSAVYVNGITQTCSFTQAYECVSPSSLTAPDAGAPSDAGSSPNGGGGPVLVPDAGTPDANLASIDPAQCGGFVGRIGPTGPSVETTCTEYYGPQPTTFLTAGRCPGTNVACTCLNGNAATGVCALQIAYDPLAPDFCAHPCNPGTGKQ